MNAQRTADIETIHTFVAAVEASQRNRSPDDFIAPFSPDAVWVTGGGIRLTERDEIDAFTRRVLTPALGDVHATYMPTDRGSRASWKAPRLYVLKRNAEGWKFASSHNGFIQPQ